MPLILLGLFVLTGTAQAQEQAPAAPDRQPVNTTIAMPDPKTLARSDWEVHSLYQESNGHVRILRGHAEIEDNTLLIRADEISYDDDTHMVTAKGNVYYHSFLKNTQIWCDSLEYNSDNEKGKFYNVRGEAQPRVVVRRGILSGNSPFHFEGEWAERLGAKYILYNGWITNCKMPKPWWRMKGPKFDIIPYDRALAYRSTFLIRSLPLFYTPYFYHSLEKQPRHSGILIPNLVPHSQRGFMIGLGYFWAINRSYDLTYRFQDYNTSAFGHHVDFRGKPRAGTDFDFILYGVQDLSGVGGTATTPAVKYSGFNLYFVGHSDLGNGWNLNGVANYISSFRFQGNWSQSFNEAVNGEIRSVGFLDRKWDSFTVDVAISRLEDFQSSELQVTSASGATSYESNAVLLHKLPEVSFSSFDRQLFQDLPVWFSFYSAAGLLSRSEPVFTTNSAGQPTLPLIETFRTEPFTPRLDLAPHVTTALHFWHIDIVPSIGIDETYYGEQQSLSPLGPPHGIVLYQVTPNGIVRSERDFSLDVILPSLARVFDKKTIFGDKLKHVIEPRITYKYVTGIGSDFDRYLRFDQTDLLTNTNELTLSLTNRIYAKRGNDVIEIFSWDVAQKRYFDPTFGGALVNGQPNVLASTVDLTAYAFLAQPRGYSPIVSTLRANPTAALGFQWQADYDPFYHRLVDSSFSVDYHWKKYFASAGNNEVRINPILVPPANQYRFRVGVGDPQHRGWNVGYDAVYDAHAGLLQTQTGQVTYNTDCCGFSVQYRRLDFGTTDRSELTVAFSIANVGTFGSLKKQDRLF